MIDSNREGRETDGTQCIDHDRGDLSISEHRRRPNDVGVALPELAEPTSLWLL